MREIKGIVVHCSATSDGQEVTIEDIDQWHRARGWRKVGYHFVIEVDGSVQKGRDLAEIGAHVEGSNSKTIGICMVGTARFSTEQWRALSELHHSLSEQFPLASWMGHRDYSPDLDGDGIIEPREWLKTCPGFDVRAWLERNKVPAAENLLTES